MGLTVLHASDLQCGRPFLTSAADALVRLAESVDPDVVVVAGDLTQRAKAREFEVAVELIRSLPEVPVVLTPGNHDVPLYRFWERALSPFAKWRHFISNDLDTITRVGGATFVALSSAAPRRAIVNGRIDSHQLDFALRAFEAAPDDDFRCLVIHHHFVPVPSGDGGRPLPRAGRWLEAIEDAGVDVVFGGHVHQTHLSTSRDLLPGRPGPGVPLVACGTTTSRRGRGPETGVNSLAIVDLDGDAIDVTPYHLRSGSPDFHGGDKRVFARPRAAGATRMGVGEAGE